MGERFIRWAAKRTSDPCFGCEFKENPVKYADTWYPRIHIVASCVDVLGTQPGKMRFELCQSRAQDSLDPQLQQMQYVEVFERLAEQQKRGQSPEVEG